MKDHTVVVTVREPKKGLYGRKVTEVCHYDFGTLEEMLDRFGLEYVMKCLHNGHKFETIKKNVEEMRKEEGWA